MEYTFNPVYSSFFGNLETFSQRASVIFRLAIDDYHIHDSIEAKVSNPYHTGRFEHLLYLKCWIDSVQWHVEDEIRKPTIHANIALRLKRLIDRLNQERTNKVEMMDNCLLESFNGVRLMPGARVNTESPAWALDRLSILHLKIYHMKAETMREGTSADHRALCMQKLAVLQEQDKDISLSINELLLDIAHGYKCMKVYRQMKMYNDPTLNPVLYNTLK